MIVGIGLVRMRKVVTWEIKVLIVYNIIAWRKIGVKKENFSLWIKSKMEKINKILFAETKSKYYYTYPNWYLPLKKKCNKLITFDWRWNFVVQGKEKCNKMFLELIRKEKPDYVFSWARGDDVDLNVLLKIKEVSPNTKTVLFLGDEPTTYDIYTRYMMLFYDYGLVGAGADKYIPKYKKDGIRAFPVIGTVNTDFFRPLSQYEITSGSYKNNGKN